MYSMTMGSVFPFSVTPPALMLMAITLEKTEVDCAQGDDLRTFLCDFVSSLTRLEFTATASRSTERIAEAGYYGIVDSVMGRI